MAVIAVTGASGFVGRRALSDLARPNHAVIGIVREAGTKSMRAVGEIGPDTDWTRALAGVEVVVHCAARAHVMRERAENPMPFYRSVNVGGTRRLAEQAAHLGVRRVVFLSSVKAAGERSAPGRPLTVSDTPTPEDDYGISKREAELALLEVGAATGLETVIIRPPLVYGPGVKGNFLRLIGAIARGWPLPLGALDNRRSTVSLATSVTSSVSASSRRSQLAGHSSFRTVRTYLLRLWREGWEWRSIAPHDCCPCRVLFCLCLGR